MRKALDKLAAFLHDCKVGAEIGVEHIVKTKLPQRGSQNARRGLLRREAKILCPRRAHGRRDLHDGRNGRIGEHTVDVIGIVPLFQRAHRAVGHTLPAVGTQGSGELIRLRGADRGAGAGSDHIPDMHTLHLVADLHAAHAFDAAVFKSQNR